ncbi:MAG: GNAT family N-acetyltransferase [Acidothermaceae bacterium]
MTDTLEFRDATLDDAAAVVALVESAYRGEASKAGWTTEADLLHGQRTDPESVKAIVESPAARIVVAADGATGELLACCQIERRAEGAAYFGMFAVRPGLQGGGVGKALLAEAERRAREEWRADHMEMTVITQREELIAWYVRRGYAKTGDSRPFPYGDERFGLPLRDDLEFSVLVKKFS